MSGYQKLLSMQKHFQSMKSLTHLKGSYDKVTTVAIPLGFVGVGVFLVGRGLSNMARGVGRLE
ncbi:hypothetical protein BSKO_01696 [Bryopsis sp. KO-2023]|nr:hypothetical protein BSKO_01696 [Bryopsis sp. KO-2023]